MKTLSAIIKFLVVIFLGKRLRKLFYNGNPLFYITKITYL